MKINQGALFVILGLFMASFVHAANFIPVLNNPFSVFIERITSVRQNVLERPVAPRSLNVPVRIVRRAPALPLRSTQIMTDFCHSRVTESQCEGSSACAWKPLLNKCDYRLPEFNGVSGELIRPPIDPGFTITAACGGRETMTACLFDQKCLWNTTPNGQCRRHSFSPAGLSDRGACGQWNRKVDCERERDYQICIWDEEDHDSCEPISINDEIPTFSEQCRLNPTRNVNRAACEAPVTASCIWAVDLDNYCVGRNSAEQSQCQGIVSKSICSGIFSDSGGVACRWVTNGSCSPKP